MLGTKWAIWLQVPPVTQNLYTKHGFEEVREYPIDLGDYGFLPQEERKIDGEYVWKFMVLRETSGSATEKPDGARKLNKGKSNNQLRENVEERLAASPLDKSKGKVQTLDDLQIDEDSYPAHGDFLEDDAGQRSAWEEADK